MAKYEKKKKKKGYGKVFGFCVIVGCIAALLWGFGGNFGLGGGLLPWGQAGGNGNGNGSGGYASQNNQPQETPQPPAGETNGENGNGEEDSPELIIRVVRDAIYHDSQQITIDELVPLLEELNYPGAIWELQDYYAIVETYENVLALMREHEIEFIERVI